ncbi:MAG: GNAT family N-acetyltransferase [Solirubrobacterales bacterium]
MIEIRDATRDDAAAIATINAAAWRSGYRGIVDDSILDALPAAQWAREIAGHIGGVCGDSFSRVATEGDDVVGSCYVAAPGREEPEDSDVAELVAIYVHPDRWRRGVGSGLISDAIAAVAGRGYRELVLWTFERNSAARSFYRRHGFEADGGSGRFMPGDVPTISMRRPLN